jgi:hypothetical protein
LNAIKKLLPDTLRLASLVEISAITHNQAGRFQDSIIHIPVFFLSWCSSHLTDMKWHIDTQFASVDKQPQIDLHTSLSDGQRAMVF